MLINKKWVLISVGTVALVFFLFQTNSSSIKENDACLCTEILSNETLLENKTKMPSVIKCIETFEDFENAHLECMNTFKFKPPQVRLDSLKSI